MLIFLDFLSLFLVSFWMFFGRKNEEEYVDQLSQLILLLVQNFSSWNFWIFDQTSSSFYHAPFGRFSFLFVALYNSFFILSFLFYWAKYMSQKGDNLVSQAFLQLTYFLVKFPTWSFDFSNKFKMASIKCHLLFSSCVWAYFSYGKVRRYWLHHTSSYIFVHF